MQIIPLLLKELDHEVQTTRKMLQRIPDDQLDFKPHEKSMAMKVLAVHIAELPSWISMALHTTELDFAATPYSPTPATTVQDILDIFEKSVTNGRAALEAANEEDLIPDWTLKNGDQILMKLNKYGVIRHAYSQTVHHRAQLGVYLRLLNIPIPGSYGPSADESF